MDILNWLEKEGYLDDYSGEWIVLSGRATGGDMCVETLVFHGKHWNDAMDIIKKEREKGPEFCAFAIKIP